MTLRVLYPVLRPTKSHYSIETHSCGRPSKRGLAEQLALCHFTRPSFQPPQARLRVWLRETRVTQPKMKNCISTVYREVSHQCALSRYSKTGQWTDTGVWRHYRYSTVPSTDHSRVSLRYHYCHTLLRRYKSEAMYQCCTPVKNLSKNTVMYFY